MRADEPGGDQVTTVQAETLAPWGFREPQPGGERPSEGRYFWTQLRPGSRVNILKRPRRCIERGSRQIEYARVAPREQLRRVQHLQAEWQAAGVESFRRTLQPFCGAFRGQMPVEPDQTVNLRHRRIADHQIVTRR